MKKTALIIALIISIFYLNGCLVITTKDHKHHRHDNAACEPDK